MKLSIDGKKIGGVERCFIIAEIGQSHDGSLGLAHSYIEAVANTGADAIKFQTHIAEAESTSEELFRVNFSYEDATRYDYWKRMEFTPDQWHGLKKHCDDLGVIFLSSPFSVEAVALLEKLNVSAWKVGSGEINNPLLFDAMIQTQKPMLISTGMSSWEELDTIIAMLTKTKIGHAVFQSTSKYPTTLKEVGLNVLDEMRNKYSVPIGLSDHSGSMSPSIAAIAKSADLLEVHVVFDKGMFGPDSSSSIELVTLQQIVQFRNDFYELTRNPVNKDLMEKKLRTTKAIFNKSVVLKKRVSKGTVIKKHNLTGKKPGTGIPIQDVDQCVGKKAARDLTASHILKWEDMMD